MVLRVAELLEVIFIVVEIIFVFFLVNVFFDFYVFLLFIVVLLVGILLVKTNIRIVFPTSTRFIDFLILLILFRNYTPKNLVLRPER